MDFQLAAEAIAIQLDRAKDYKLIKSLEIDILAARIVSIKNEFNKTGIVPYHLFQTINCLEFKKVKDNKCIDDSGYVLRSTQKIPLPLMLGNNLNLIVFNSFLNANFKKTLDIIKPQDIEDIKHRTFTSKEIYVVYENSYLYLVGLEIYKLNKFIGSIRGIFNDPREVKKIAIASKEDEFCKECDECTECNSNEEDEFCFNTDTFELEESLYTDIQRIILSKRIQISQASSDIKINEI